MGFLADVDRLWLVKVLVAIGTLCCLWSSRRIWTSPRPCPRTPLASLFKAKLPDTTLYQVLLIPVAAILVSSNPAFPIAGFILLSVGLSIFDWARFQPWLYHHLILLSAIALFSSNQAEEGLNICRLANISIYFWAGILKLNANFAHTVLPLLVYLFTLKLPPGACQRWLSLWGHPPNLDSATQSQLITEQVRKYALVIPLIEAGFGLGLLFPQTRQLAALLAAGMHCSILFWLSAVGREDSLTLGPWKACFKLIGPWNFCMMLTTFVLFWGCDAPGCGDILIGERGIFHLLTLLFFALMPGLGFFNLLDPVFSHGHWSGRHVNGYLCLSRRIYDQLPTATQQLCKVGGPIAYTLDIAGWYMHEMGVPAVQQERLLLEVARYFRRYGAGPKDLALSITRMPATRSTETNWKFYTGQDLFNAAVDRL